MRMFASQRLCILGASVMVLTTLSPARAAPGPFLNGGFESSSTDPSPFMSTGDGGVGTYAQVAPLTGANPALYGAYFYAFNGGDASPNAVLSQTFSTVAGDLYSVTYDYGNYNASGAFSIQSITTTIYDGMAIGGTTLGTATSTQNVRGNQTDLGSIYATPTTLTFLASSTSSTIAFVDSATSSTESTDGFLDNIVIQAAAPELDLGSAFAPLALGVFGMLLLHDRRRHSPLQA
jgi:hypothetical protein